ncbi:hypothetical protein ACIQM4_24010 [Streptomyces sp. NPDC091272]|uniref:hypothetical protein n=1 Tax=Streptomyces sp. NPDC091272 TaxID=3365981 RepID=UPI00382F4A50
MFEYEIQQSRHAELVARADRARLVRQAREGAKAARAARADKGADGGRGGKGPRAGAGRTLRDHFTRAA